MRDLDEANSGKKNRNDNPFFNIEPDMGSIHLRENDEEQDGYEDPSSIFAAQKKSLGLSLLSKRTLLVSVIVLMGFIGIFMWPWIFDVFGFVALNGSDASSKSNVDVAQVIRLPLQAHQDSSRTNIALAPSPVESHARAPKLEEDFPNALPVISQTNRSAQGVSTGSSHVDRNSHLEKRIEPEKEKAPLQNTVAVPESPVPPESEPQPNTQTSRNKPSPESQSQIQIPQPTSEIQPRSEVRPPKSTETLLLNRQQDHYTIQILAMQDEQKLKAFMNQSELKNKMSFYSTLRNGKPWFVVVYGDFETKQQAESALLELPTDIQKNKPWIKSMRDVQGAIRAKS